MVMQAQNDGAARLTALRQEYEAARARGLKLDMSRGKPGPEQLALSMGLLDCVSERTGADADGVDTRNYGLNDGLPAMKAMMGDVLGLPAEQVIVGGNSSLNMMFDYIATAYAHGRCGGAPWCRAERAAFLCPSPGYDRHFAVTQYFGFDLITIPMTPTGPDMDAVEAAVADPAVKGIWCVPMYSNPDGITYSDDTVRRLAAMKTAAADFVVMWDNAYCLHHLTDTPDVLLDFYAECEKQGHADRAVMFCSTSKISFPGGGVAAMGGSPAVIADVKKRLAVQTIGPDKINELRHLRFYGDADGLRRHMKRHQSILRPKFDVVLHTLEHRLGGKDVATWNTPRGGYFVSVNVADGCAKRTLALLGGLGVTMTSAGATYPYGRDPRDRNIRIAPTYPPLDELRTAMELFCLCAELAVYEQKQAAAR